MVRVRGPYCPASSLRFSGHSPSRDCAFWPFVHSVSQVLRSASGLPTTPVDQQLPRLGSQGSVSPMSRPGRHSLSTPAQSPQPKAKRSRRSSASATSPVSPSDGQPSPGFSPSSGVVQRLEVLDAVLDVPLEVVDRDIGPRKQLLALSELGKYGVVVNRFYSILVCVQCSLDLPPNDASVLSHLRTHHYYDISRQSVKDWLIRFDINRQPKDFKPGGPAIQGVAVVPGFRCGYPGCTYAAGSKVTITKRHINLAHRGTLPSDIPIFAAQVQRLRSGVFYLPEQDGPEPPPLPLGSAHGILREFQSALHEARDARPSGTSLKQANPFLLRTGMLDFAKDRSAAHLSVLAATTSPPVRGHPYHGTVFALCRSYFQLCLDHIKPSPEDLVLRHIRSETCVLWFCASSLVRV